MWWCGYDVTCFFSDVILRHFDAFFSLFPGTETEACQARLGLAMGYMLSSGLWGGHCSWWNFCMFFSDIYELHGKRTLENSAGWLDGFIVLSKKTQMLLTPQKANMTGWKIHHFQWEIHRLKVDESYIPRKTRNSPKLPTSAARKTSGWEDQALGRWSFGSFSTKIATHPDIAHPRPTMKGIPL